MTTSSTTIPTTDADRQPAGHLLASAGASPPAPPAGDGGAPRIPPRKLTIVDFLTDGSLVGLCHELSRLLGVRAELHDPRGHAVLKASPTSSIAGLSAGSTATPIPFSPPAITPVPGPAAPGQGVTPPPGTQSPPPPRGWVIADNPSPLANAAITRIPLMVAGECIGALVLAPGQPTLSADARRRAESMMSLLGRTASELCEQQLELKHTVKEVGALARMSTLLTRAASPQKVLEVALDQALDVLGMDAGSIMLLREREDHTLSQDEADLVPAVSRGLSRAWLDHPQPLSKDRLFDRMALAGQVVTSEDIALDDRILLRDMAQDEGLRSALHAGLVFKNRPLGVIRLYAREPRSFDESDKRLLASLANQCASALEQARLLDLEKEEQQTQRQIALAADVQRRMLPRGVPNFPQLDVAARYVPSFELGGDFYDFIDLSGHLGVAVGDVVGKGIAAALLMSSVRASLRAFASELYDLDEIVARVNQALCRDTREAEFASLWYGVIDPHKMRLTYCSGGHEPPMVVRVPKHRPPTMADLDELTVGGMVVGIDPSQRYQRAVFDIRPGDVLLAYTDGVPDATNFSGERFGKRRLRDTLLRTLQEKPTANAGEIVDRILWELRTFSGLSQIRSDDKTIVAVRVR